MKHKHAVIDGQASAKAADGRGTGMLDDTTTDIQCCDDSGDDERMMVGSDDHFSDLETKGTTPLIVLLFIGVSKEGGRLSIDMPVFYT